MYLHRDREIFTGMIGQAADSSGVTPAVVEKDYYVTLILRLLAGQLEQCVFKGQMRVPAASRLFASNAKNGVGSNS